MEYNLNQFDLSLKAIGTWDGGAHNVYKFLTLLEDGMRGGGGVTHQVDVAVAGESHLYNQLFLKDSVNNFWMIRGVMVAGVSVR